jgi:glycerol-3-phosphate O-acyltransferase
MAYERTIETNRKSMAHEVDDSELFRKSIDHGRRVTCHGGHTPPTTRKTSLFSTYTEYHRHSRVMTQDTYTLQSSQLTATEIIPRRIRRSLDHEKGVTGHDGTAKETLKRIHRDQSNTNDRNKSECH